MGGNSKIYSLWLPLILVFVNFIAKGIFLSFNSLAGDEPFSVFHAQLNIQEIIYALIDGNNPPLYEIFLHFWVKLFGISEFSIRFPSLIFSSFSVWYIYKFGVKFLNFRIALISSILFIFSNYHVLFAQEARVYSLLGLLSIMSMYYFLCLFHKGKGLSDNQEVSNLNLWWYILVNVFLIYAHYFGFFILITQLIFILAQPKYLKRLWKKIIIAALALFVAYAPYIVVVVQRLVSSSKGTWVTPPDGLIDVYFLLRQLTNEPVVTIVALVILIYSIVHYFIQRKNKKINTAIGLVIFWYVSIFFGMFLISFKIPVFIDRYIMPSSIGFLLTLGIAIDYVSQKKRIYYLPAIIIILGFVFTFNPKKTNKRNVREAVAKVKKLKTDQTAIYICADWFDLNFIYYFDRDVFKKVNNKDYKSEINSYFIEKNIYPINHKNQLKPKGNDVNKVIFLDAAADNTFPDNDIKKTLDKNYTLLSHHYFYEVFNIFEYSAELNQ